ncbi:hypothetical protein M011DRAFT_404045 [Sporormia fimetaria CBS 119925]|uniref:Cohesin loading factor n=1 Tax=Sporormia fimetaria CBS 119925 TaxID=1340428 RepID=A0A6A6V7T8_9PLEO|nr:hypothetical protein M011DRAFT_404045 [Sporormia fimetaria CBS 119925]
MEATLKNYVLEPRQQATLMFRYASLLIEETENGIEIEETLSKGIALCARSRFLDLKYSFHHLQARYEAKSNLRAALKSLDAPINEAETFQHMVWVYALRFLRVSLALQAPGRAELAGALQQLHAIANQAEKRGDRAVFVTASALEAMIHLRTPGADHLEQAQRAIAAARSYQLEASVKSLGSVGALIDTVDLACSLQKGLSDDRKMHALQQRADKEPGSDDGAFSVLIEKSVGGQSLTQHTGGIIRKVQGGRDELVFYWLPKDDLKILAFYLSGITTVPQELNRGRAYLQEGHRIIADAARRPTPYPLSPPKVIFQRNWIITLDFHLRFALGLSACRAEDEKQAANTLEKLRRLSTSTPFSASDLYSIQVLYLSAVLSQTFGPLSDALQTYAHKELTLTPASTTSPHRHPLHTTLAILATLNHALILRSPTHPSHHLLPSLLSTLETHFPHPSTALTTAHTLIRALTLPPLPLSSTTPTITASALPTLPITQQRKLISSALTASQELKNHHFVVMALAFMAYRFFAESVGDQAVKSVRAVRSVARKQGVLWKVTSAGLCVLVFERNGLVGDAAECKDVVRELGDGLPAELRGVLGWVGVKEEEEDERISG